MKEAGSKYFIPKYQDIEIPRYLDEDSHTHSEAAYDVLEDSFIGFVATPKVIDATVKSSRPSEIVPLPSTLDGIVELEKNGAADAVPTYAATGMASAEDLSKETDLATDYKTHKFLDLNKPLLLQVWFGGFSKDFYLEQVHRPRHYKGGESAPLFGNFLEPLSKTPWFLFHLDKWLPDNRVALTAHFLLHGIHHYLPMDKLRLVMPPTLFLVLAIPFWRFAHTVIFWNWHMATAAFCGGIFGYICYDLTHYFLHHPCPDQINHTVFIMSALDVEALLDSTANATPTEPNGSSRKDGDDRHKSERNDRRDRERNRDSRDDRRGGRNESRRVSRSPKREATPPLTEDERDRRTVFVQQLAARLRTRDLIGFFEKVGPVKEAQIVKDRVSGRSKGVGYVEFKNEESVPAAIQLTGQKLLGIPIIAQLTEAEKNRQVRNPEAAGSNPNSIPFHRLYNVFEPFGELEFVQLQKEEQGRSRGYGFVQFRDPNQAREALEKMNGFDLAGRPIRVGLGNDKFTPESTASLLQRFQGQSHQQQFQGSAFSGAGGRGPQAANGSNFDRAGGRDNDKSAGGASALDDTDVGESKPLPPGVNMASRCVVLKHMFDPTGQDNDDWIKELEDEVRAEAEAKYGHVVHIAIDPNSDGDIYLKFDRVQGGENAIKGLNGRFFDGRTINATPVVDAVYSRTPGKIHEVCFSR
ncbi:putative RNA-binding protein rsd1 [Glarea lozoyensis 74030]|uniref:Putative RNA-binding protein rsd1 n=1 Tax=Glarea lozoyensis (strain ATCC 74030 / MF5533) TaxID=1104152 RepID=H0ELM6_GLAL7|nr:putative RNA-binding protein rsd1 [Glarea lozoyensis 74030]